MPNIRLRGAAASANGEGIGGVSALELSMEESCQMCSGKRRRAEAGELRSEGGWELKDRFNRGAEKM
jgi:hypothetical protein